MTGRLKSRNRPCHGHFILIGITVVSASLLAAPPEDPAPSNSPQLPDARANRPTQLPEPAFSREFDARVQVLFPLRATYAATNPILLYSDHTVYAFDPFKRDIIWTSDWPFDCFPTVILADPQQDLFLRSGQDLIRLDYKSGRRLWRRTTAQPGRDTAGEDVERRVRINYVLGSGGKVLLDTSDDSSHKELFCLNSHDGSLLWRRSGDRIVLPPIAMKDLDALVALVLDGAGYRLRSLSWADGSLISQTETLKGGGPIAVEPAGSDQLLLIQTDQVACFEGPSLTPLWTKSHNTLVRCGRGGVISSTRWALDDRNLYLFTSDQIRSINLNTGHTIWERAIKPPATGFYNCSGRLLIVGSKEWFVCDAKDGSELDRGTCPPGGSTVLSTGDRLYAHMGWKNPGQGTIRHRLLQFVSPPVRPDTRGSATSPSWTTWGWFTTDANTTASVHVIPSGICIVRHNRSDRSHRFEFIPFSEADESQP